MDKNSVVFLKDMGNRVIQKLHTLPREIIYYILSCIDVTLLRFLLGDKPLQPYVLRIMLEKIAIDPRVYPSSNRRLICMATTTPIVRTSVIDYDLAEMYGIFPKEIVLFSISQTELVENKWLQKADSLHFHFWLSESYDGLDYRLMNNLRFRMRTLWVNFADKRKQYEFLRRYQDSLTEIRFKANEKLSRLETLRNFHCLKTLNLHSANQNIFNVLPPSLEALFVSWFETTRNPSAIDKSPMQLKELHLNVTKGVGKLGKFLSRMTNLKKLEIKCISLARIQELQLPLSITKLEFCECVMLKNYKGIELLSQLTELRIKGSDFPLQLFQDEHNFTKLKRLEYYQYSYPFKLGKRRGLGRLNFPINLEYLDLSGELKITSMALPSELRTLKLHRVCFTNPSFTFRFPEKLYFFSLDLCLIKSMDNVIFPLGLQELHLNSNSKLKSMKGTNTDKLRNLLQVEIHNNAFNPNSELKFNLRKTARMRISGP